MIAHQLIYLNLIKPSQLIIQHTYFVNKFKCNVHPSDILRQRRHRYLTRCAKQRRTHLS